MSNVSQGAPAPTLPERLRSFPRTDAGNAERIVADHGEDIRFVPGRGFHVWGETGWALDQNEHEVRRRAILSARWTRESETKHATSKNRKAIRKWANDSENLGRINAAISIMKLMVLANGEDFDTYPYLLNVKNGIVDLRSGLLSPHRRDAFLTKMAAVAYDPDAKCPTWDAFMDRVFAGNAALIEAVEMGLGYSLTGETSAQVFFIIVGPGANGKSVLMKLMVRLLHEYAAVVDIGVFCSRRQDSERSYAFAALEGVRFVTASEPNAGAGLDEGIIKAASGGERLPARRLYQAPFSFEPRFKLWLTTNTLPAIRATDEGMWRRPLVVPMNVTIPVDERDPDLADRLWAERDGIFFRLIRGARRWFETRRLLVPAEIAASTAQYRRDEDTIGQFVTECCEMDAGGQAFLATLYATYEDWARASGESPTSKRHFVKALIERFGCSKHRGAKGAVTIDGIRTSGSGWRP